MLPSSLEGQTLGKYRVLEPLGRGGMARVYRGYHPQLDRFVAIKVLRPDLLDDDLFITRFRREAQSVAALRHPHIIQVHDFDIQDGLYYMVMELLDGDTLHKRLTDYRVRGQQMALGEMIRIMLDVLDGLAYAHSEGVIHRDIKPSNILLTKRGQVVIADFGIAQIVGGTQHTVSGALLGTLNYMAPEQGLKGISDERSDIYAAGIILYEMLTQQPPFDAETPLAILMKHANDPLPLPREIKPDIPEALERVVLKALAKEPEDRYQSAEAMAAALRQAAADTHIDLPDFTSPPLSFTTTEDHSESVAVISGTARGQLQDADFAQPETAFTSVTDHLNQLKAAEAAERQQTPADKPTVVPSPNKSATESSADSSGETAVILTGIGLPIAINLLIVFLSGPAGPGRVFENGWPFEFFAVAAGLFYMMYNLRIIWFLIPGGILSTLGYIMTYSALSDNWEHWVFLWPLLIFAIGFYIWHTIRLSHRPTHKQLSARLGRRRFIIALVTIPIVCLAAVLT